MKILLILLLSGTILPVFAENYYYFEDQKLSVPPEFCIIEFSDPQLPGASEKLYQITQNAIKEWEDKLVRYTGEKQGWDFTTKIISEAQRQDRHRGHLTGTSEEVTPAPSRSRRHSRGRTSG